MTYYQHKIKCLKCGLHFVVCSDYEDWPNEGTTRDQNLGEATGVIHCPECGTQNFGIHWKEQVEGFIFQTVPGAAEIVDLKR
jgi:ssDNA-binding Zn-finger/Zn-ribbon topoisomerase 1